MGLFKKGPKGPKLWTMSDEERLKLAEDPNTPGDKLDELIYDDKLLEVVAANPKTPKEALSKRLLELIKDRESDKREFANEVISKIKLKHFPQGEKNLFCLELTKLLIKSSLYKSIDIVKALGSLKCRESVNIILKLIQSVMWDFQHYEYQAARGYSDENISYLKSDTDEPSRTVDKVCFEFLRNAVKALGDIGEHESIDTLKEIVRYRAKSGMSSGMGHELKAHARGALQKIQKQRAKPKTKKQK